MTTTDTATTATLHVDGEELSYLTALVEQRYLLMRSEQPNEHERLVVEGLLGKLNELAPEWFKEAKAADLAERF